MNRWDLLVVFGILLVAVGAALIYIPAGLIVAGLGIGALGIVGAIADARAPGDETKDVKTL